MLRRTNFPLPLSCYSSRVNLTLSYASVACLALGYRPQEWPPSSPGMRNAVLGLMVKHSLSPITRQMKMLFMIPNINLSPPQQETINISAQTFSPADRRGYEQYQITHFSGGKASHRCLHVRVRSHLPLEGTGHREAPGVSQTPGSNGWCQPLFTPQLARRPPPDKPPCPLAHSLWVSTCL